jgi:alkylation response protein AidB-like acyl-CoA dehydrogenase
MTFLVDATQTELLNSVRAFLARYSSAENVRKAIGSDAGHDVGLYSRMATELGLQGIAFPEEFGGSGATFIELGLVLAELGRALVPGPFFSSVVLAGQALLLSEDTELCHEWLPRIADGSSTATLALFEGGRDWDLQGMNTTASHGSASGWTLTGTKRLVTDGMDADLLIVSSATPDGPGLFAVSKDAPGLIRTELDNFYLTRRIADIEFRDTSARLVGTPGRGAHVLSAVWDRAAIALACEQAGSAAKCLEAACAHATFRTQFDRLIGSFQAVKHLLADLLVDVESATAAAQYASWTVDHSPGETAKVAALSKAFASDTYSSAARLNIQIHGAIAFTWEHDAHLHLRKATSTAQFLGSPELHREHLARFLFDNRVEG